jgi:hypothetical protein
MSFQEDLEEVARRLYANSCCGSKEHWKDIKTPEDFANDPELRNKFMSSAHKGMRAAQKEIVESITGGENLTPSHFSLYRGIADAIAWQFLGNQLCHARRLFKGHNQPNLKQCNLESVIKVSDNYVEENPDSMALISDLTSFIQVGDILTFNPVKGIGLIEVKEGEQNYKISNFLHFFLEHKCERSFQYFAAQEGPKSIEQLGRMVRQMARMNHFGEVYKKGISIDPDTKDKVSIPEEPLIIESWEAELNQILEDSSKRGWAITVIDDCLFIGCYSKSPMLGAGHFIFNTWFDGCGGTPDCPRARLLDSMRHPLALSIFNLNIPDDYKFDLLFGRKQICMGFNVKNYIEKCRDSGLKIKTATKKQVVRMDQAGRRPYRYEGEAFVIGNGNNELFLMDGIFHRAMFHLQKPISLTQAILSNSSILTGKPNH